jgi:ribose transport system substrate-binding protein
MNRSVKAIVALAAATCLASLSACSSGGSGGGSTPSAAASTPAGSSSSAGTTALQSRVTAALAAPTGIGIDTPLSRKPASGKFVVGILTPLAVAKTESAAQGQAAALLGWKYKEIQEGTGPQDAPNALDAAIALKPDAIIYYGTPVQPMAAGLEKAKTAGIAVVATSQVDPLAPPIIANNSNSGPQLKVVGQGLADYVALNSDSKAKVALVTLPAFPVLKAFGDGFKSQLAADCSSCSVTEVPQQLTDIGTVTPTSVVSALRRDPSIKYVIFDNGSTATGVSAAVTAAGIQGVVIGGEAPSAASIQDLKSGQNEAWAALSIPILGFGLIDVLARHFNGDSLSPNVDSPPPFQILTKDNVATASLDSQGNYTGYANFSAAFAKLWLVG